MKIYRYYFRVIEPYIKDNAQLMNVLISLRKKYRVWLNESTIATLSDEGTLCGVNSEVSNAIIQEYQNINLRPIFRVFILQIAFMKCVQGTTLNQGSLSWNVLSGSRCSLRQLISQII